MQRTTKPNEDLRQWARVNDVRTYQIADRLGIHNSSYCRMLNKELSEDKKLSIRLIIDEIARANNG